MAQHHRIAGFGRQGGAAAGHNQVAVGGNQHTTANAGAIKALRDAALLNQQCLLLAAERAIDRSPGAGVAAEAPLYIAAVEIAQSPAPTTVHLQLLVQPQASELELVVVAPSDHPPVEDRSRQPLALLT